MTAAGQNVTPDVGNAEAEAEGAPAWLKILVVVLGLGIIGMIVLIVFTIANKATTDLVAEDKATPAAAQPAPLAQQNFDVARPQGGTLMNADLSGREILLHFRDKDGRDVIVILNRATGQESRVSIAP